MLWSFRKFESGEFLPPWRQEIFGMPHFSYRSRSKADLDVWVTLYCIWIFIGHTKDNTELKNTAWILFMRLGALKWLHEQKLHLSVPDTFWNPWAEVKYGMIY